MGYLEIWNEMDTVAYPAIVRRDAERAARTQGISEISWTGCWLPQPISRMDTRNFGGSPLRSKNSPGQVTR